MYKMANYHRNLEIIKSLFHLYKPKLYQNLTFTVIKHHQLKWDPFTNYELIYPFVDKSNIEWVEVTFKDDNWLDTNNNYIKIYCLLDQIGRFHVTDNGLLLDEFKKLDPEYPNTILAVCFVVLQFQKEMDSYFKRLRAGFAKIVRRKNNAILIKELLDEA